MFYQMSQPGSFHVNAGIENQDAIACADEGNYRVISLADGVSTCADAHTGALVASHAITNLFSKKGYYFFNFTSKKTAELGLSHILYELNQEALKQVHDVMEYSSTIVSVAFDKEKKKLLYFSLGDSMILAIGDGKCRILAVDYAGIDGCCVTTTRNAQTKVKSKVIDSDSIDQIVLLSDGAWKSMIAGGKLFPDVEEYLTHQKYDKLKEYLCESDCYDDYSFIAMNLTDDGGELGCQVGNL